jgi:hypothetical protein
VAFFPPIAHLAAKNRFSRRLVLMQKGTIVNASKMNIYFKEPQFALDFGLFGAKYAAFWC